jgi:hypothetical protein
MKYISLSKGFRAKVSDRDYARVKKYSWHVSESIDGVFYARAWIKGKHVYLHRFIKKPRKGQVAHHRDGDTLNCTRQNLINLSKEKHATYVDESYRRKNKTDDWIPF